MKNAELPPEAANPFFTDVFEAGVKNAKFGEPFEFAPGIPRRILKFDGFLGPVMEDGRRKIYSSSLLEDGYEISETAILTRRRLSESRTEGLLRDVVWVDADSDILYFSRRARPARDSIGGNGFPAPGTQTVLGGP
jgi:hypothetical protein